jgi:syntaxin 16
MARNKTEMLKNAKLEIAKRVNRFRQENERTRIGQSSTPGLDIGHGSSTLPPIWVDYYESAIDRLKKVDDLSQEINKLVVKRVKMQFGNASDLDNSINSKMTEAKDTLMACEEDHRKISEIGRKSSENNHDRAVRNNIEKALAIRIQDAARMLHKNQKNHYDKVKDDIEPGKLGESTDFSENEQQEMEMVEDLARGRNEEINKLIDTINELSHLFKQMNQLVIEQGTIVDRIDYNLESAQTSTAKAVVELRAAKKYQSSKCGDYCIKVLIIMICIFSILLLLKFKK